MYHASSTKRLIHWATWGLAKLLSTNVNPTEQRLLDIPQPFSITPASVSDVVRLESLHRVGRRPPLTLLRCLSVGLRHAHLRGDPSLAVSMGQDGIFVRTPSDIVHSIHFLSSMFSEAEPGSQRILHTPLCSDWFSPHHWMQLLPDSLDITRTESYPQSESRAYALEYVPILRRIGATREVADRWFPPRGSSADEMARFIYHSAANRIEEVSTAYAR